MSIQVLEAVLVILVVTNQVTGYLRVCYYTNWSQYRPGDGKFTPDKIDPSLCTHIIFAFGKLEGNTLVPFEWNDDNTEWSKGMYSKVNAVKKKNPRLKTLLATGGWNAGSKPYSDMVATKANRTEFILSTIDYLRTRDFDGLDLDWEYPTKRGGRPEDKARLVLLLEEMAAAFDREAAASGKDRLLITAAVPAGKTNIDAGYDVPRISRLLDFINLMSYDFHGSWESKTGHNSPLYARRSESGEDVTLNMDFAANYWVQSGAPRDKLIIGIGLYGRSFKLTSPAQSDMGAPVKGAGVAGKYSREAGFMAYYEVCDELQNGAKRIWDPDQRVPYIVKGDMWVGYDDAESIKEKIKWLKQGGFGGAMVWSLALDDFSGKFCNNGPYPLMRVINTELGNIPRSSFVDTTNTLAGISSLPSVRPVSPDPAPPINTRSRTTSNVRTVANRRRPNVRPAGASNVIRNVNRKARRRPNRRQPVATSNVITTRNRSAVRRRNPVSPVAFINAVKTPPRRFSDVAALEVVKASDPKIRPAPRSILVNNNAQASSVSQVISNVPNIQELGSEVTFLRNSAENVNINNILGPGIDPVLPNTPDIRLETRAMVPNPNQPNTDSSNTVIQNTAPEVMPVIPMEITNALLASSGRSVSELFPLNVGSDMLPSFTNIFSAPADNKPVNSSVANGNMLPPPLVVPLDNPFNSVSSITGQDSNRLASELSQNANVFSSAIQNEVIPSNPADPVSEQNNLLITEPKISSIQKTQSSKIEGLGLPELQRGPDGSFIVPTASIQEINNLMPRSSSKTSPDKPRIISLFDRDLTPITVKPAPLNGDGLTGMDVNLASPELNAVKLFESGKVDNTVDMQIKPTPVPISLSGNELLRALDQRNIATAQDSRRQTLLQTNSRSSQNSQRVANQGQRIINNSATRRRLNTDQTPFIRPILPASLSRAIVTMPIGLNVATGQRGVSNQRNAIVINPRPLRPSRQMSRSTAIANNRRLRRPETNVLSSSRLNTRVSPTNSRSRGTPRVVRLAGPRSNELVASIIGSQSLSPSQAIALRMRLNNDIRIVPLARSNT